ncbi:MAG: hypothetical protein Fur0020_15750 [Thermodesulfovibrionia bacterium]
MPEIEKEFINTGKLKYVIKDFPLQAIHPLAFGAHLSASCAGQQGKYWQMHDKIFFNVKAIDIESLKGYAKELGLDINRFDSCLNDSKWADEIRNDIKEGRDAGVDSTPTFLLGLTDPQDPTRIRATVMIKGAYPYQNFKEAIEGLLSSKR